MISTTHLATNQLLADTYVAISKAYGGAATRYRGAADEKGRISAHEHMTWYHNALLATEVALQSRGCWVDAWRDSGDARIYDGDRKVLARF